MSCKTSAVLTRLFYVLYALCFGWVLLCCVFANVIYPVYDAVASFLLMALFFILFLLVYRLLFRRANLWKRYGWLACLVAVLLTGTVQLVNGFAMRYDPAYDLWAIYGGGISWAENGALTHDDYFMGYFHMFPNNLGGAYLFRLLFGAARLLGITDYFAVALVFNVALLQLALVLCWDVLRRIGGSTAAMLGLVVFVLFPPFYMMGAVFYTDLLTVVPPILALDLYMVARGQKCCAKKALVYTAMGLAVGVGAVVKITVAIALVAVAIAALVARHRGTKGDFVRQTLLPLLCAAAAFALMLGCYRMFVQSSQLSEERLEKDAMPLSHWVAMGLIGEGGYDEADYDRAMKLPSRTARQETNRQLIITRLTQPGPVDLAKLFTRKAIRCFGDGTYDLAIFLDDGPHRRAPVHELVLFDGIYFGLYSQLSQGVYLALMALALVPPVQAALALPRGRRALRHPAPWLCMFGLFAFLMLWETNSRYTLNFMPVLVACACLGAAWFTVPGKGLQKVRVKTKEKAR